MNMLNSFLKDLVEELYHRATCSQTRDERKAIKGVQHSLENVMKKYGIDTFDRDTIQKELEDNGNNTI